MSRAKDPDEQYTALTIRSARLAALHEERAAAELTRKERFAELRLARQLRFEADELERAIDEEQHQLRRASRWSDLGRPERESSFWTTGLAILAVVGVTGVIIYLLMRRKSDGTVNLSGYDPRMMAPNQPPPQVYLINTGHAGGQITAMAPTLPAPAATPTYDDARTTAALDRIESLMQRDTVRAQRVGSPTLMKTFRLPWLGDPRNEAQAIRVANALDNPYEVTVRVVGPPGSMAAIAFSPTELMNQPLIAAGISQVPIGDTIIVPAGQRQTILMNPRQALYARGNMSPAGTTGAVVLSVSSNDSFAAR